ncbi:unnamed protein product [Absidia cylindrospora]
MRILIVTENFLPKVDGCTRTIAKLLEHLEQQQHQVMLFGPDGLADSHYASAEIVGTTGIPLFQYPGLKLNLWRPTFTNKLLAFQPQVIHLVDPVFLGAAAIAVCNIFQSSHVGAIPLVASYHTNLATYCTHFGWGLFTPLMWRFNQFCHSFCQFTVCPSQSTRSMLLEHGFDDDKVRLWPRGVNTHRFSPNHRSDALRAQWVSSAAAGGSYQEGGDKTIILYVGRVSYEKNLQLVIDTYKHMDHSACHLVVVGDGPALGSIKQSCSLLPVTFTGYLYGSDLATAYASADFFAFPSTTETFGQVVLEAMASGLPVSGLVAEGVRDLVQHKHTGLLLDSFTWQAYKQHWERLIHSPGQRVKMGQRARQVASTFTWDTAMQRLVETYKDAIKDAATSADGND